jgi:hypothetical protein
MNDLRDGLLERLQPLSLGKLHGYERYNRNTTTLADCYKVDGRLEGGFIRRLSAKVTPGGSQGNRRRQEFELTLIRSFQDELESELLFDSAIDRVIAEFENNHKLWGWTCSVGDRLGFELVRNTPAMFAGVLVHYAVLRIAFIR